MLVGLLYTLFVILCFLIIFVVLLQRSKGSLGLAGSLGGGTQALFGGSGGQDFFQKLTWFFIGSFMLGSLVLAILKNRSVNQSRYLDSIVPVAAPLAPLNAPPQPTTLPAESSAPQQ